MRRTSRSCARAVLLTFLLPGVVKPEEAGAAPPDPALARARALNQRLLILDTHIDTPTYALEHPGWNFGERHDDNHADLPRLRAAGVDAPFMVVYTPAALEPREAALHALRLCDLIHTWAETYRDALVVARSPAAVLAAKEAGRIGLVLCMENGSPVVPGRLDLLRTYYRLGVRYLSLAHSRTNLLCDSATDAPRHGGVSELGRQVIEEANRLGMMLDVSHVSDDAVRGHLRYSRAPLIASHSNARAVCPHPRNLPDELVKEIAARGGAVQLNFAAQYVSADYLEKYEARRRLRATRGREIGQGFAGDQERLEKEKLREGESPLAPPLLEEWFRHVEHLVALVGPDHIGLGSDFDGIGASPREIRDVTSLEILTAEFLHRGWSEEQLAGFYGGNLLRVWRQVEEAAGAGGRSVREEQDAPALRRFEFQRPAMAAAARIVLYAPDEAVARAAAAAAFRRVEELEAALSDYDPESELNRLCRSATRGREVPVSADLFRILARAVEISAASDGVFDVTAGPLVRLWREARRLGHLPAPERIEEARALVGHRFVRLEPERRGVRLLGESMQLDVGGIAKGYAAGAALEVLAARGIERALVDLGGDIALGLPPPGASGWRVAVASCGGDGDPGPYLELSTAAVATSGDTEQFALIGGRRYSHIVDPRTGEAVTRRGCATAVAPDGMSADALASAACVLEPEEALALIERTPGAAARIVLLLEDGPRSYESRRWKSLVVAEPGAPAAEQPLAAGGQPGGGAAPGGGGYRDERRRR